MNYDRKAMHATRKDQQSTAKNMRENTRKPAEGADGFFSIFAIKWIF
jgi:hypothetical protein